VTDDTPTPIPDTSRQTGWRSVAAGAVADCRRMAEQLEARAEVIAVGTGRADLSMRRTAHQLRSLARNYEAWGTERTGEAERAADRENLLRWYRDGQDALAAHPAP
jgi:hypothetical protein